MKKNRFQTLNKNWSLPEAEFIQFFKRRSDVAIIIPVLNEGDRFHKQLAHMQNLLNQYDLLICDGGSTDHSCDPEILKKFNVCSVIYKKSEGKMSSQLRLLFAKVIEDGYLSCIHMDGNAKDDPKCIPLYDNKLKEGYDLVAGSRFLPGAIEENTPCDRKLAIRWIHAPILSAAAGFHFTDTTNSFRGYSARLIRSERLSIFRDVFVAYNLPYYFLAQAPKLGFQCCEIPVNRRYKKETHLASKIVGFSGRWGILKELFYTVTGKYNP